MIDRENVEGLVGWTEGASQTLKIQGQDYASGKFAKVAEALTTLFTRVQEAEAERDAAKAREARLKRGLSDILQMCCNAQPTTVDRYIDRVEERAREALGKMEASDG